MPIKASTCLEVGTALAAAVCGAADIGVRLVVLHKNSSITEVTITATSGARKLKVSRSYLLHMTKTYRSQKSVPSGSCE